MRAETAERRPHTTEDAAQDRSATKHHDGAQSTELAALARRREYGIRVTFERADGVVCQQIYVGNTDAAERKVRRVRERGLRAELHLVRLVPVGLALNTDTVPSTLAAVLDGVSA